MSFLVETPGADTVIVVSTDRKYKLHSAQLMQCSTRFSDLLQDGGPPTLSREALKAGVHYMVCLQDHDEATGRHIIPTFRRIQVNKDGKPTKGFSQMHESDKSTRFRPSIFSDYERLIRVFANQPITLNDKSIETLLPDAMGLIEVAEKLGSVSMIAKLIEISLLGKGQDFFKAVSVSPVVWIDVALRLESKILFKEALVHLTGKYNTLSLMPPDNSFLRKNPRARSVLDQLKPELRDLLERKHKELKKLCQAVEVGVSTHYPSGIQKSAVTGRADRDGTGRAQYARDVFTWISVALYRHWWGQTLAGDANHNNRFGGHDIYVRLHEGGQAYLTREITIGFNTHFPMSNKAQAVVENNLDIIKAGIVPIVAPLMKNESQLDLVNNPVKWLTCTKVKGADYVWEPEPELEPESEEEEEEGEEEEHRQLRDKGKGKRPADEAFEEEEEEEDKAEDEDDEDDEDA
ncbi:hypothetical protein E4T39_03707 [Aureobasidium subglaciale]|nr:hypothetical protein E4T39_03707 [Aureobasidium subglaciale]